MPDVDDPEYFPAGQKEHAIAPPPEVCPSGHKEQVADPAERLFQLYNWSNLVHLKRKKSQLGRLNIHWQIHLKIDQVHMASTLESPGNC